jgi:hypothetical protein
MTILRRYALGQAMRVAVRKVPERSARSAADSSPPPPRWNSSRPPVKVPRQRIRSNAGSPVSFTTLGVCVSVHAAAVRANMPVV